MIVKTHRILFLTALLIIVPACHRSAPSAAKRYPFTGRVVSLDPQSQSAVIDGDKIPGFMDAMAMEYKIKPASTLSGLAVGDSISAEVVVQSAGDSAAPDYWLENVKVTAHSKTPTTTPTAQRLPAAGDFVPNFAFINQDGRRITLHQYRGKVLLITFIYTRCPFPDFCPRMSSNFNEIYNQVGSSKSLANVRLLSVSFDPEHDTPKVLRDYAFSVAHAQKPSMFQTWQFAVPTAAELPKIADFFGVIYKAEGGMITHNLSTTVIGPDGKIVTWYHGNDWQVSDLIKDASGALSQKG
jgi:protein SCO1